MGPTVWELEGPMPILKMSKTLVDMTLGRTAVRPYGEAMESCRDGDSSLAGSEPIC